MSFYSYSNNYTSDMSEMNDCHTSHMNRGCCCKPTRCPSPYPPCPCCPCPPPEHPEFMPVTTQNLEAYTLGTSTLNTLTNTRLSANLSFVTLGESQGTSITYSPSTPTTITLNAPGRYLVLVKGSISFTRTAATTTPVTLTTSLLQDTSVQDQTSTTFNATTAAQAFTLQALVCNNLASTPLTVQGLAATLTGAETINYSNLNIIIIKLSNQPC